MVRHPRFAVVLAALALAGCGIRGPLYLPPATPAQPAPPATSAPAPATTAPATDPAKPPAPAPADNPGITDKRP
jgi:predicted small lipoprotein YifL